MKLKHLVVGLIVLLIFLIFSSLSVLAQEQPPSLENHQFYGKVYWDATAKDPQNVVVKGGSSTFTSVIKKGACSDKTCSGSYGTDADTILRVQAQDGAVLSFYLDLLKVGEKTYQAGGVTVYDINVAKDPFVDPNCIQKWEDCTSWSSCTGGKQSRTCTDSNKCKQDELTRSETQSCGATTNAKTADLKPEAEIVKCSYQWDCSGWGTCVNDQQTQTCARIDTCDALFDAGEVDLVVEVAKPAEVKACIRGVTGNLPLKTTGAAAPLLPAPVGKVPPSVEEREGISPWVYVGIFALIIGAIGLWLVLRRRSTAPPQY
ncbi:hypothetical protein HY496_00275 [Candidatus Woesearchaeota archaeon]|nr:hypothetical protein [Candidatus Woesearchaeota archaeon]